MNEKTKENATIVGATTAGAAIGAGAVLGVNAAMATPKPTTQADDKKAEIKAEEAKTEEDKADEVKVEDVNAANQEQPAPQADKANDEGHASGKDYANDAEIAANEAHRTAATDAQVNTGIHTSQNVNVHVNHREVITPTEEQVTPEVEVVEYKMQINADGSTTDVAVLSVDGHNAMAIDATGDHMADVIALDINGDGIYQQDEIIDVTGSNMDMGELAQQHMLNGGTLEVSLDPSLVAQSQEMMPDQTLMADNSADFNSDYNNDANVDDFVI